MKSRLFMFLLLLGFPITSKQIFFLSRNESHSRDRLFSWLSYFLLLFYLFFLIIHIQVLKKYILQVLHVATVTEAKLLDVSQMRIGWKLRKRGKWIIVREKLSLVYFKNFFPFLSFSSSSALANCVYMKRHRQASFTSFSFFAHEMITSLMVGRCKGEEFFIRGTSWGIMWGKLWRIIKLFP